MTDGKHLFWLSNSILGLGEYVNGCPSGVLQQFPKMFGTIFDNKEINNDVGIVSFNPLLQFGSLAKIVVNFFQMSGHIGSSFGASFNESLGLFITKPPGGEKWATPFSRLRDAMTIRNL